MAEGASASSTDCPDLLHPDVDQEKLEEQRLSACSAGLDIKRKSEDQTQPLLQKIENTVEENGGKCMRKKMRRRRRKSLNTVETNFSGESPSEEQDDLHQAPESKDQIRSGSAGRKQIHFSNGVNPSVSSSSTVMKCRDYAVSTHPMKRRKLNTVL